MRIIRRKYDEYDESELIELIPEELKPREVDYKEIKLHDEETIDNADVLNESQDENVEELFIEEEHKELSTDDMEEESEVPSREEKEQESESIGDTEEKADMEGENSKPQNKNTGSQEKNGDGADNKKQAVPKKKIRNSNIFRLFVALIVMAGCAALGAGIAIFEDKSDPTEYVGRYFGKFMMQDFDGMYDFVDKEGSYITKSAFKKLMENKYRENNVGEYEFGDLEKKNGKYLITVTYKDARTDQKKKFDIYLKKERKDITQVVADWKVSLEDSLVNDVTIKVPVGTDLKLNGELIKAGTEGVEIKDLSNIQTAEGETIEMAPEKSNDAEKTYTFSKLLKGTYDIDATTDYTQIAQSVDIKNNSQKIDVDESKIAVSDKYRKILETNASEMIKEYYDVVRNRKTSGKKLLTYFKNDKKLVDNVKKLTKKDIDIIFWPGTRDIEDYNLIKCEFSALKNTMTYIGNNQFKVTYNYSYDYESATNTSIESSYVYSLKGTCKTTMTLVYEVTDNKANITQITIKNTNKKQKNK